MTSAATRPWIRSPRRLVKSRGTTILVAPGGTPGQGILGLCSKCPRHWRFRRRRRLCDNALAHTPWDEQRQCSHRSVRQLSGSTETRYRPLARESGRSYLLRAWWISSVPGSKAAPAPLLARPAGGTADEPAWARNHSITHRPVALVSGNARMLTRSPFGSATMKCLMPKASSRRSSAIRKPSLTAVAYAASTSST